MTPEQVEKIMGHISQLNDDYTELAVQYAVLAEKVSMLERWFWAIAIGIAIGLIGAGFNYLKTYRVHEEIKNNK